MTAVIYIFFKHRSQKNYVSHEHNIRTISNPHTKNIHKHIATKRKFLFSSSETVRQEFLASIGLEGLKYREESNL